MRCLRSSWLLTALLCVLLPTAAHAEGSWELTSNPGNMGARPYLLYRNRPSSGISREGVIQVYAKSGETIHLGSSANGKNSGQGQIRWRDPNGNTGTCPTTKGIIANRKQEVAGPDIDGNVTGDEFVPCSLAVGTSQTGTDGSGSVGIWEIEFVSPNTNGGTSPPFQGVDADWNAQSDDDFFITAWDITVEGASELDPNTTERKKGRVFADYFAWRVGAGNSLESEVTIVTEDGYSYALDFNGLDPDGFVFFANNKGFRESSGEPIFRSLQLEHDGSAGRRSQAFPPGFNVHLPTTSDSAASALDGDYTHKIFINEPNSDLPNSVVPTKVNPSTPNNFRFVGYEGTLNQAGRGIDNDPNNVNAYPRGGIFKFTSNATSYTTYRIDLSFLDSNNNPVGDKRILLGRVDSSGEVRVAWDGLDDNGNILDASVAKVSAEVTLAVGEVHLPLFDPENSKGLNLASSDGTNVALYYDDRNRWQQGEAYSLCSATSSGGVEGGTTNNTKFCYGTPGSPRSLFSSLPSASTGGTVHSWTDKFGDARGMDTWINVPGSTVSLSNTIVIKSAELETEKKIGIVDDQNTPDESDDTITNLEDEAEIAPGDKVVYFISHTNNRTYNLSNTTYNSSNLEPSNSTINESGNDVEDRALIEDSFPEQIEGVTWQCIVVDSMTAISQALFDSFDSQAKCDQSIGSGNISEYVTLAAGKKAIFRAEGQLSSSVEIGTQVRNNGKVTRPNDVTDPNLTNNDDDAVITVGEVKTTTLDITKVESTPDNNPNPGNIIYDIEIKNTGSAIAQNVIFTDVVPNGLTFVESASSGCAFTNTGETIECSIGNIGVGETERLTIVFNTDNYDFSTIDRTTVKNLAKADGSNTDEVTDETEFQLTADISVNKVLAASNTGANFGDEFTYTITAKNNSTKYKAYDVIITDTLELKDATNSNGEPIKVPVGEFISASDLGTEANGVVTWDIDELEPGETVMRTVTVRLSEDESQTGQLRNDDNNIYTDTASVNSANDPNPNNNSDSVETPVPLNSTDISIKKTVAGTFTIGSTLTYTITVENIGQADATNVVVADTSLDGVFTLQSAPSITGGNGSCVINTSPNPNGFSCDIGTLEVSGTGRREITATYQVPADYSGDASVPNTATVDFDNDVDPNNNSAMATTELSDAQADLVIAKEGPTSGDAGEFTYTITVKNDDTSSAITGTVATATNVKVTDTIADGATFVEASAVNGNAASFDEDERKVTWTVGDLAPGEERSMTVTVNLNADGRYRNNAGKSSDTFDPNSSNDVAEAATNISVVDGNFRVVKRITDVIRNGSSLSTIDFSSFIDDPNDEDDNASGWFNLGTLAGVYKIPTTSDIQSGDIVEYTLYFLSDGNAALSNVSVCDAIPIGTSFITNSFGGSQGIRLLEGGLTTALTNAADNDKGRYFTPLAPVSSPCTPTNNPNGSVLVTFPSLAVDEVGYIRFRVQVN